MTQSTGHGVDAHFRISLSWPQSFPFPDGSDTIVLNRLITPPPHFLSHLDQKPQGLTLQSEAHTCVLHRRDWIFSGHVAPPNFDFLHGCVRVPLFTCEPCSHGFHLTMPMCIPGNPAPMHVDAPVHVSFHVIAAAQLCDCDSALHLRGRSGQADEGCRADAD